MSLLLVLALTPPSLRHPSSTSVPASQILLLYILFPSLSAQHQLSLAPANACGLNIEIHSFGDHHLYGIYAP